MINVPAQADSIPAVITLGRSTTHHGKTKRDAARRAASIIAGATGLLRTALGLASNYELP
jgi:hypothetical protein